MVNDRAELLNTILSDHVNTWLQWAEAKHGVLLAANAATLFGWGGIVADAKVNPMPSGMVCVCVISIILLGLSIICSLKSFYPNLGRAKASTQIKNVVYFNDCARHTDQSYYQKVMGMTEELLSKDLSEEVVMNSKIAARKYKLFKRALIYTGGSYILFTVFLLAHLL